MTTEFTYLARQPNGRIERRSAHADSPEALRQQVRASGSQLISFQEIARKTSTTLPLDWSIWSRYLASLRISWRQQELALRQLAMLLRSGLDLLAALRTVQQQSTSKAMHQTLGGIIERVASGHSLGQAMADANVFPLVAVQLVTVGETTGHLSEVLEQAARHMSERRTMISEVRVAMAYPVIVATAAVGIAVYLILGVIPELQKFLSAMGRRLPAMTQSLVDLSNWLRLHGTTVTVIGTSLLIAFVVLMAFPPARFLFDRMILRLPIVGGVLRLAGTASLASSLAIMIRSGVQLVPALTVAERLQANRYLAHRVQQARQTVLTGQGLASALQRDDAYLPMLGSMVEVAQQTGTLDGTLEDVSQFCQSELKTRIKRLSMMVEPAIIVVAGCIVGYVYMAFFMALMSAGGNIR